MKNRSLLVCLVSLFLAACANEQSVKQPVVEQTPDTVNNIADAPGAKNTESPVLNGQTVIVSEKLRLLYQEDLKNDFIPEESRKFLLDSADLNSDGNQELFVFLQGSYFCGSGGCTLLLFNNRAELLSKFTVTSIPVAIANTQSQGWQDLILFSGSKKHLVKYDGKKYPSNPSITPVAGSGDQPAKTLFQNNEQYVRHSF